MNSVNYNLRNTVDWEIFAVKNFSPVAYVAEIKRMKISYTCG